MWVVTGILAALLMGGAQILAQGGHDLSWWTVDDGGDTSGDGTYIMRGTIGQVDAGTMDDGTYRLTGGFWSGATPDGEVDVWVIYLPIASRGSAQ
jgi:hypothetical protein